VHAEVPSTKIANVYKDEDGGGKVSLVRSHVGLSLRKIFGTERLR
jgi:hypothetical protein